MYGRVETKYMPIHQHVCGKVKCRAYHDNDNVRAMLIDSKRRIC